MVDLKFKKLLYHNWLEELPWEINWHGLVNILSMSGKKDGRGGKNYWP